MSRGHTRHQRERGRGGGAGAGGLSWRNLEGEGVRAVGVGAGGGRGRAGSIAGVEACNEQDDADVDAMNLAKAKELSLEAPGSPSE